MILSRIDRFCIFFNKQEKEPRQMICTFSFQSGPDGCVGETQRPATETHTQFKRESTDAAKVK